MGNDLQQPPKIGHDGSDKSHDLFPGQKERRHPNFLFCASRIVSTDDILDSNKCLRRVDPPPQPEALPSWALLRDANDLFPLINKEQPPFPFVDPTTVMPATIEEKEARHSLPRVSTPRLPVVTPRNFSFHYLRRIPNPAVLQLKQQSAPTAQKVLPQYQAVTANPKMPPPSPRSLLKRKRDG